VNKALILMRIKFYDQIPYCLKEEREREREERRYKPGERKKSKRKNGVGKGALLL
jgi:hypothetical protein